MVERYVAGARVDLRRHRHFVTDVIEIKSPEGSRLLRFEAKYAPGGSKHELPANLIPDIYHLVRKYTLAAHVALGCRGALGRIFVSTTPKVERAS